MRNWHKFTVIGLGVLTSTVMGERSSVALEPTDNTAPFSDHKNASLFGCPTQNCNWIDTEQVSTSTDVDYFIVSCGFLQWKLQNVRIDLNGAAGDLDIEVYQLDGTYVGGSYSTGNQELVNTASTTANGLVLKVYGFSGATNTYTVGVVCS